MMYIMRPLLGDAASAGELGLLVLTASSPLLLGASADRTAALAATVYGISVWAFSFASGEAHGTSVTATLGVVTALGVQALPTFGVPPVATILVCVALIRWTYDRLVCIHLPSRGMSKLDGMVVVVTGSSAGLGEATAERLLGLGAIVVFACRDETRARAAMARACSASAAPASRAIFVPLDVASCASICECARRVRMLRLGDSGASRCDALVCNAGAMHPERHVSADGWELNMACHALGHHLLTLLLLPLLRASSLVGGGRVVAVSSCLHRGADAAAMLADPMCGYRYGLFDAYARSKLAQVALTNELQRREPQRLVCVSLHPGNSITEVTRAFHPFVVRAYAAFHFFLKLVQNPVADGAATSVFAVASTGVSELRGAYLERCAIAAPVPAAVDEAIGRSMWELADRLLRPWLEKGAAAESTQSVTRRRAHASAPTPQRDSSAATASASLGREGIG